MSDGALVADCSRTLSSKPEELRFDYLDALRGIAILAVILVHSSVMSQQEEWLGIVGFSGQRGVQLFYMVSAFTLFHRLDSRQTEHHRWSNFYIRRFCRIAPMFYLAIIANLLLFGRVVSQDPYIALNKFDILLGFLLLHGLSPRAVNGVAIGGWSVGAEVLFYLVVPFLFVRIKTISRAVLVFVCSAPILMQVSQLIAIQRETFKFREYFRFLWFPVEFPVFCLGIVAFLIWKRFVRPGTLGEGETREISMVLIVASGIVYLSTIPLRNPELYYSSFVFLPLILALSLRPWPLFVNRFTIFMGKISYSVYLCHFFVLWIVERILARLDRTQGHFTTQYLYARPLGLIVAYLLVLGISIPICVLTWRFVEQPGIRAGRNWIRRRETQVASAQAELSPVSQST